ncbi:alginate export family protein [Sphingobium sp. AS12]|uniref:alginate export family protein n=1 Tax=Sphingobium sp. AS12 TaxID=2849495 RepID=UPI001C319F18|nr:alginate export family protein [Sphingobium sp. AS12]MBV2147778.1 alginate export family protein [Sphingobium sp. AS12]
MKYLYATAATLVAAGTAMSTAQAQSIKLKPVAEARLRYEHADQEGLATEKSDALTIRARAGLIATSGGLSATVIGQGNLAVVDKYFDGLNGAATRPIVADPENIALYIAQLQYKTKMVTLTGGRQRIALDDERFIGNVAFRNNGQTFDAMRMELTPAKGLKLDVSYAWSVRTIWGFQGKGARQQAVSGDNIFANLSYVTPVGTLTGFAYLVDQDEAPMQAYRLSSQTYGVRLAGTQPLSKAAKLSYQLSYARQADHHANPNDYSADYWLADATLDVKGWKLNAGYEVLGASSGAPFTSFQTPLGTNFKFQGWADKFLTTPGNGIRDLYVGGGYGWKQLGPLSAVALQVAWHRFDSDRLDQHYGDEINLIASAKVKKTALSVRYAKYDAKTMATDTQKLWLQADWAY